MVHERGYTLLEILLSLTIVAVLSLVFLGTTQKMQQKNQIATAALQMNAITDAAINYYKIYKEWPSSVAALTSLLGQDMSCSVWKNASGCTRYTVPIATNPHYFALTVTPPNATIAADLVAQLPSAYQSGTTVTAYTTTFSGFKVQPQTPPAGTLLSANSQQLNGSCNTTASGKVYSNPFTNCVSSSSTPLKPYSLVDINAQPKNAIVSQNVFAIMRGAGNIGASIASNTASICAPGNVRTMIFLPVGVRTTVTNTDGTYRYINSSFNTRLQATFLPFIGNGGSDPKYYNVAAGVGDIVCLPANAIAPGWGGG